MNNVIHKSDTKRKKNTNLHFFLIHDLFMPIIEIKMIAQCTWTSIHLHGQAWCEEERFPVEVDYSRYNFFIGRPTANPKTEQPMNGKPDSVSVLHLIEMSMESGVAGFRY